MRKNLNRETITGRLFDHTLEAKVSQKGVPYIGGVLEIAVDEEGLNVIPVTFTYVAETYPSSGKANKNYPVLQQLLNAKTWKTNGKDEAVIVKCDSATLGVNNFVGRDGKMVAAMRNEGSFVSIVTKLPDEAERATFSVDIIINKVAEKEDAEGNSLGYDEVGGRIFCYPGMAVPVTLIVRVPEGIKYFEGLDASNDNLIYTNVRGKIESITTTKQIVEESAFGGDSVRTVERTTKAWVIEKANPVPFDLGSEETMTEEDVAAAVQAYNVHLAEVQKNYDEYQAKKGSAPAASTASAPAPAQKAKFAGF